MARMESVSNRHLQVTTIWTNILFNVKTQDDVPEDSDYDTIKKDYQSIPNKEYLNNHFLKRDSRGIYFDLKGMSLKNSEVYDPNSWSAKTITNKEYVDLRDNLKAEKTELVRKADLETNDEQTFKGILSVCLILTVGIAICPM